NFGLPLVPP
ncbi:hypothetical protein SCA6_020067, partial [Theobroma cacao]